MDVHTEKIANAKRRARLVARQNGHKLGGWYVENGKQTAMCGCGGSSQIVDRDGFVYVTHGTDRVLEGATRPDETCRRERATLASVPA